MSHEEKSHVGMLMQQCPICGKNEATSILLDRRLRASLPRESQGPPEICKECRSKLDDGYIALIVCDPEKSKVEPPDADGFQRAKPTEAYRTGDIAWMREESVEQMFGRKLGLFAFIEPGVFELLQKMAGEIPDVPLTHPPIVAPEKKGN